MPNKINDNDFVKTLEKGQDNFNGASHLYGRDKALALHSALNHHDKVFSKIMHDLPTKTPMDYYILNAINKYAYEQNWSIAESPVYQTHVYFDDNIDDLIKTLEKSAEHPENVLLNAFNLYLGAKDQIDHDIADYGYTENQDIDELTDEIASDDVLSIGCGAMDDAVVDVDDKHKNVPIIDYIRQIGTYNDVMHFKDIMRAVHLWH